MTATLSLDEMMRAIAPGDVYRCELENNYRGERSMSVERHPDSGGPLFTLRYYDEEADYRKRSFKRPHSAWNFLARYVPADGQWRKVDLSA